MFDLIRIGPVIDHLKSISQFYQDSGNEVIIHCPFCDDSTRTNANRHGHCYLSKSHPVFHCFRCSSSGTLLRLLIETDFKDDEILRFLSQSLSYKFTKDYYQLKKKDIKLNFVYSEIVKQNLSFYQDNKDKFEVYKSYLKNRLGDIDFTKFLISPGFFHNKLCCNFNNSNQELIVQRLIDDDNKYRYHLNKQSSGLYFFQEKDFEKFNRIVFAEGPFDIIPLYLYNIEFKDCFFIDLNGKKYISALEKLILEDLLIGNYQINFIFDTDVFDYKKYLYRAEKLIQTYNNNIEIKGYKALIKKDTGDFPVVSKV